MFIFAPVAFLFLVPSRTRPLKLGSKNGHRTRNFEPGDDHHAHWKKASLFEGSWRLVDAFVSASSAPKLRQSAGRSSDREELLAHHWNNWHSFSIGTIVIIIIINHMTLWIHCLQEASLFAQQGEEEVALVLVLSFRLSGHLRAASWGRQTPPRARTGHPG